MWIEWAEKLESGVVSRAIKKALAKQYNRHDFEQDQIADGHEWNVWLGKQFAAAGLKADVPAYPGRTPTVEEIDEYSDVGDVFVEGIRFEGKALYTKPFTGLSDFGYDPLIVDRCHTWNRKVGRGREPAFVCNICSVHRAIVGFPVELTKPTWTKGPVKDRTRTQWGVKERDHFWVSKAYLFSWPDIIKWVKVHRE